MTSTNIIDSFTEYFDMVPACTDELKNEVYKLRYQVYCNETGFEDPTKHPQKIEVDEFDNNSIHYLIRHRKSDIYAATTRLILPNAENPENPFPIEQHCEIDDLDVLRIIPRTHLAEVSRFCVSKEFKRRKKELGTLTGIGPDNTESYTENERRTFPHITIALIACLVRMSYESQITHWYAVMEPALLRFLSTLGINFTNIGPLTFYHGNRQPCVIKIKNLLDGVEQKNFSLWEMISNNGEFDNF